MGASNCSTCTFNCGEENTVELKEVLKKNRQNSLLAKSANSAYFKIYFYHF